ncbi:universal stress protein [Clavibacter sp. Sh2141]|uniref:universal stress protein n=1 Tax=Clavibacter sp. Sh2141 TaxID=3395374 RepID=UPI0039BC3146
MSARTASRTPSPVGDRQAVIAEAAASLATRFPAVPRDSVMRVAGDVHDAIVGNGVPVRGYLRNLVVHDARSRLAAEERATGADRDRTPARPPVPVGRWAQEATRPPTVTAPSTGTATSTATAPAPTATVPSADARPVVAGVDGSPASEAALDRALVMAEALGVPLRVVSAWRFPMVSEQLPSSDTTPEEDVRSVVDDSLRARFGDRIPAWISVATPQGPPAHVLVEESRAAQMLVVGSRGHGGVVGLLLGSVSAACAEHAHCPVLVMHDPRRERGARPGATA